MSASKEIIDLRSDTVTRPTPAMLKAMFSAEVGDDVFDEDPTIKALEKKSAAMFGHEASLFCPSGTMTNQIGIQVLTNPGEEVLLDKQAHIYFHEGGGLAVNSGLSIRLLNGDRGRITPQQIVENINPPQNLHQPITSVVTIENTHNKGGGSCYTFEQITEIVKVSRENKLKLHLDGARIFNAITETGDDIKKIGKLFDTISVCLSKGLGAPVGSMLISNSENIHKARRIRKRMGGGMRQAGFLAAAGIYALDHNLERLKEDHFRARIIGEELKKFFWVDAILPVETNIVVFRLKDGKPLKSFLEYLSSKNIHAVPFGNQLVRMVTHLDFNDAMLEKLLKALRDY